LKRASLLVFGEALPSGKELLRRASFTHFVQQNIYQIITTTFIPDRKSKITSQFFVIHTFTVKCFAFIFLEIEKF
jgi:hypothetical protein